VVRPRVSYCKYDGGANVLFMAVELDRRLYLCIPFRDALKQLKNMQGHLQPAMGIVKTLTRELGGNLEITSGEASDS
jgi:hypothetical protein